MDGGVMELSMASGLGEQEKLKLSPAVPKGLSTPSPHSWSLSLRYPSHSGNHRQHKRPNAASGNQGKENSIQPTQKQIFPVEALKNNPDAGQQRCSPRLKSKKSATAPGNVMSSSTVRRSASRSTTAAHNRTIRPAQITGTPSSAASTSTRTAAPAEALSTSNPQGGRRRRKAGSRGGSTSSAFGDGQTLRSMWDSVVAMMKTAVDTILFDDDQDDDNGSSYHSPAKRRCEAETGMRLRASERSEQAIRRSQSRLGRNIEPSKIKEAKKLDPNARKVRRRVTRKQSVFSRSNTQITPPRSKTGDDAGSSLSPSSFPHVTPASSVQELSVFTFRLSPLSNKVASALASPTPHIQHERSGSDSGIEQLGSPSRRQVCPMPLKRMPSCHGSSGTDTGTSGTAGRLPVHLAIQSPLCSPLFRDKTAAVQPSETSQTSSEGLARHSEASIKDPLSRPTSRSGSRAVGRSRSLAKSSRITPSGTPSRSPTPTYIDPLLRMKVSSSAMPVRTAKRPRFKSKHGSDTVKVAKNRATSGVTSNNVASSSSNSMVQTSTGAPPPPPPPPPLPPGLVPEPLETRTDLPSGPPPPPPPAPKMQSKAVMAAPTPGGTTTQSRADRVLAGMQERLRTRMRHAAEKVKPAKKDTPEIDPKVLQWAAIQSKYRKMSTEAFLEMAESQRAEALRQIHALSVHLPTAMNEIVQCVENMAVATCWWPGGVKEMKETIPEWKLLEPKLDTMEEYIKVVQSMAEVPVMPDSPQVEFHLEIARLRESFLKWHRNWSSVLLSNAASWRSLLMPVDDSLLDHARFYLAELVLQMSHRVSEETAQLHGKSIKRNHRLAKQLTSMLQECLEYLTLSLELVMPRSTSALPAHNEDEDNRLSSLFSATKSAAVLCTQRYIEMANAQYLAVVHTHPKLEVTAHFDGILKTLGLLKALARRSLGSSMPWRALAQKGVLHHFSGTAADLSEAIYKSCASVLQHIMNATGASGGGSSGTATANSASTQTGSDDGSSMPPEATQREMVLWLMFGCKFLNRSLEMLGDDGHSNIKDLLDSLQRIEDNLPLQ